MKREENQTVEYKESWHEKYLEWICGYANAKGGTLYIGIEDGTKKPVGVKNPNKLMEDIPNSIRNTMGIVADVALLKKQGKNVIRIKVAASAFPVSYQGRFHYRTGSVKMLLTGPALTQFLMERSGQEWDCVSCFGGFRRVAAISALRICLNGSISWNARAAGSRSSTRTTRNCRSTLGNACPSLSPRVTTFALHCRIFSMDSQTNSSSQPSTTRHTECRRRPQDKVDAPRAERGSERHKIDGALHLRPHRLDGG